MNGVMPTTYLLTANRLFAVLAKSPKETVFYLWESAQHFQKKPVKHAQLVFHRASMQAMREKLLIKGFTVHYLDTVEYSNFTLVAERIRSDKATSISLFGDGKAEQLLKKQLANIDINATCQPLPERIGTSSNGLSLPSADLNEIAGCAIEPNRYVEEAAAYVSIYFPNGRSKNGHFHWAVTHGDAEECLESSIEQGTCTPDLLSPYLAHGLLTPERVWQAISSNSYTELAKSIWRKKLAVWR